MSETENVAAMSKQERESYWKLKRSGKLVRELKDKLAECKKGTERYQNVLEELQEERRLTTVAQEILER